MRPEFEICRVKYHDTGTYGVMSQDGLPFAVTLELPWKNNQTDISCIPTGFYFCTKYSSGKYGNTYQIMDVHGRTYILFHKANWTRNLKGCIGVAEKYHDFDGDPETTDDIGVADSKGGFEEFLEKTGGAPTFTLHIYDSHRAGRSNERNMS